VPDSLVVVAFFWIGLSVFGFGYWVGMNKTNQRWRAWLKRHV
jgi:hypothetical protein